MKDKKIGIILTIIIAVVAIVAFSSIAYAAFTQQLDIDGSAKVSSSSWKVKFSNLAGAQLTGNAKELVAPTINTNDTKIGDYSVTLSNPGDSVKYTFDVVNEGTFDAEVSSITVPTPTCTGSGTNGTQDSTNVCNNLTYTLTYADGSSIQVGDTLVAGDTKSMILTLTYSSSVTTDILPSNDVAISNLATIIVYSQS